MINEIKQIAQEAGQILLDFYDTDFQNTIVYKEDQTPVTIADKAASDFICDKLIKLYPEIPVISEEGTILDYDQRKDFKYFWLIDPLDGTNEFIKKNGQFTVNIALINYNRPVLGVVYVPVSNDLYWALEKKGAYHETSREVKRIFASEISDFNNNVRVLMSRSFLDEKNNEFLRNFNNVHIEYMGSSLKFMTIGEGKADLYFRFGKVCEWDTAASHIILNEAGGQIKNLKNGNDIIYNKTEMIIPPFIVTGKINSKNFEQLIKYANSLLY